MPERLTEAFFSSFLLLILIFFDRLFQEVIAEAEE